MPADKKSPLILPGLLGIIVLIASEILMFKGIEPFSTWFYPLAWWSYILIIDNLIYRLKGNSLIISRPKEFFLLIPWSVTIWLVFELINLRINNWHYLNIEGNLGLRWIGYFLSYATVLPGLFETTELLEILGLYKKGGDKKIKITPNQQRVFLFLGILFFFAPLIFPYYGFPLAWLSLIFIFEPINYRLKVKSLVREGEGGSFRKLYLLLTSGLICGFLWEFWNYWALSKWVYTVPLFEEIKWFEMPPLGFLGFPPFTVQCYVIYNFISYFRQGRSWEEDSYQLTSLKQIPLGGKIALSLGMIAFFIGAFWSIDLFTVISFK